MSTVKPTPMLKQYLEIKDQYPDAILFYRMGDFYEMFFGDAEKASRILEITLTSRNKNDAAPVPMCGVPYRAAQSYIARLIESGNKVAICDQVEDPAKAKGLVKREVVRVVTPGMLIENELLDAKTHNYVLAAVMSAAGSGLAYLDISTGTFRLAETRQPLQLVEEVTRVDAAEVLVPTTAVDDPHYAHLLNRLDDGTVTLQDESLFDYGSCRRRLLQQFNTLNLEGFGCEGLKFGIRAAGALLQYVLDTQKQPLKHLHGVETVQLDRYLQLDELSCRNLELLGSIRTGGRRGSLLEVVDRTQTAMGGRLLKQWLRYPLIDTDEIQQRLDAVEEACRRPTDMQQIRDLLKAVYDLERLAGKAALGHANARDLVALKRSLQQLPAIQTVVTEGFRQRLFQWPLDTGRLTELADLMERAIREDAPPVISEGGIIKPGFNDELDTLVAVSKDGKGWLARLENKEREETGIGALKVRFNKVFGYFIEVPNRHAESVPVHYIRKQTLVNAERFITDELKQFESQVLGAEEKRAALEYDLFVEIRTTIQAQSQPIQDAARLLARMDCLLALADVAARNDYCKPRINDQGRIRLTDGRHPVVEKTISGERYVPNSIEINNEDQQVLIITGPNMAGKSTVLRQVAITVLMAQIGSFVPAAEADIGLTDRIFTRVGALDNLSQGQSTFMVEMQETANILHNATPRSLVIMDEIGRGTSTFDGLSIAWAVAEHLHHLKGVGVRALFATHYHELTNLAASHPRVKNFNIAVKEWNDEIVFLRKLVPGGTNRSYGIQVARLAGIPPDVVGRAKKILYEIENGQGPAGESIAASSGQDQEPDQHVQLNLFRHPGEALVDRLAGLDTDRLTPLDALNTLSEFQKAARKATKR